MTALEVLSPGPLALVEDLGRSGHAALGVAESGAFDRAALRLANRLVGNAEAAPGIEALGGGLALRATAPCLVAVTGTEGGLTLTRTGRAQSVARRSPLHLRAGDVLTVGVPVGGLRSYVAVRGGLQVVRTLGSAAYDTLARLGPAPVTAGDLLPVGRHTTAVPHVDHAPVRPAEGPLGVVLGPRDGWFTADAVAALLSTAWVVTPDSDRVGLRLDGPVLARREPGRELPSEPMVAGALQVPPDGRPVLLGPDHPTTGGYPVIAVVLRDDVDRAAQLAPGTTLRLQHVNAV